MSLKYDFQVRNASFDRKKKNYRACAIKQGDVNEEELITMVAKSTSLSEGDVKSALISLTTNVLYHLTQGRTVHLGDLGHFSVQLTSPAVDSPDVKRYNKVKYKGVKYQPSNYMNHKLMHTPIQRSQQEIRFHHSTDLSMEELRDEAKILLARDEIFSCPQFMRITGCLRSKARRVLNAFIEEGWLKKEGKPPYVFYREKKN
jgi:predicted histone-like DNA-binding protein